MADTIMKPNDVYVKAQKAATPEDDVILAVWTTERPEKFGMVRYERDGRVIEVVDKPSRTELTEMWGAIIWRQKFTEHLRHCVLDENIGDFAQIMNSAISSGMQFRAVHMANGTYIDLGTYEEIMELDQRFRAED